MMRRSRETLTPKDLDHFRRLLLDKRAQIINDLSSMSSGLQTNGAGQSHYADDLADVGSDESEQGLTLDLVQSERELLRAIDNALERMEAGTYGVCDMTGQPISRPRLEAVPWTQYCIEAARQIERRRD